MRSSVLEQLVPRLLGCHAISDGAGVDTSNSSMGLEVDADHVRGLMQERISSHVMEVRPSQLQGGITLGKVYTVSKFLHCMCLSKLVTYVTNAGPSRFGLAMIRHGRLVCGRLHISCNAHA